MRGTLLNLEFIVDINIVFPQNAKSMLHAFHVRLNASYTALDTESPKSLRKSFLARPSICRKYIRASFSAIIA